MMSGGMEHGQSREVSHICIQTLGRMLGILPTGLCSSKPSYVLAQEIGYKPQAGS